VRGVPEAPARFEYGQARFLLKIYEVNRTVCGRGHVLQTRASGYKGDGGIARHVEVIKGREASRR